MLTWLSVAFADPPAPATCAVSKPSFTVDGQTRTAGTMFAVKVGDRTALVTAHDLLGPNGGLAAQLGPDEVVAKVSAVAAVDAGDGTTVCGRSTRALRVDGALPMGGGNDASRDVAVFLPATSSLLDASKATERGFVPFAFAAAAPKVGDPVWVAFPVGGTALQAAKVVEVNAGFLFVEYTNRELQLAGSVGAPILDASGAVVGLNLGVGKMDDGALIGSGTPLPALRDRVTAALGAP